MQAPAGEDWVTLACRPPLDRDWSDGRIWPVTVRARVFGCWAVTPVERPWQEEPCWTVTDTVSGCRVDPEFYSHAEACLFAGHLALLLPEPPRPPSSRAAKQAGGRAVDEAIARFRADWLRLHPRQAGEPELP